MGHLRRAWITLASEVAWRLPGWPIRFLRAFRDTEHGSALDMLAAAELTDRRDLRRKYFLHALDERRHAAIFRARAEARAGSSREEAATQDSGVASAYALVDGQTLFERLGELEFLAFVHVAEAEAVEQFEVYQARRLPDEDTREALARILKDEHFHVSYSRAELERYRAQGRAREVAAAVRAVRWRRVREGWLGLSRGIGAGVTAVWLTLLYAVAVGPFRVFARVEPGGWRRGVPEVRPIAQAARSQG